jgi:ParB-like chromosome segregation protein Spo0J
MELPINKLKLSYYEKIISDLSKKVFKKLKESIEKWGIIKPIVINQNNMIVCVKERYRASVLRKSIRRK